MQSSNRTATETGGPLVSVGIPTYNRPAGLRRTLDRIVHQTHRNLEILVSDNCSPTPETEAMVREYQRLDPRIIYHRQPRNIGLEANFKFVLREARGTFFFWAADDDEWTADFVKVCLSAIGDAGSVMTGMRNAVRSQGLLRWKPPVQITPERNCFENATAFFTNLQPSLFYGLHRTETLRLLLREPFYDYYDCFFILRQILSHGFRIAPQVCFHVGIDSETPIFKPARPRNGAIYEYWPFLRDTLSTTISSARLTFAQKCRLCFLLSYVGINEFTHFERTARPARVKLLALAKRLMRAVAPLVRVPLPPAPSAMVLPDNPVDLCSMFIPHADLQSEEKLRQRIDDARRQLDEKLTVICSLENELERHRTAFLARPALGRLARIARKLSLAGRIDSQVSEGSPTLPSSATPSLERAKAELGGLLLQLEEKETSIHQLAALLHLSIRRNTRLETVGKLLHPASSLAVAARMLRRFAVRARASSKKVWGPISSR